MSWPHLIAIAVIFVAGTWVGAQSGNSRAAKAELALSYAQRDIAQQVADAEAKARHVYEQQVDAMAQLAEDTQKELTDAKQRESELSDQLVNGTRGLRHEIAALHTASLSREAAVAAQPDPAAERGAALVAAAIGVGAKCDATQAALIEAYEALRRPAP